MSHFVIIDTIQSKKRSYSQTKTYNYLSSTTLTKVLPDKRFKKTLTDDVDLSEQHSNT